MIFDLAMAIVLRILKSKMPSRVKELSRKFNTHLYFLINFSVPNQIRCLLFLLGTVKFIFTYNMLSRVCHTNVHEVEEAAKLD